MRWLTLAVVLIALPVAAEVDYGSASATFNRIIDGDTFVATVENWQAIAGDHVPIRVEGINTPELHRGCKRAEAVAAKARDRAEALLAGAEGIRLSHIHRDDFFRLDADVDLLYANKPVVNLGDELIREGLAVPYAERKVKTWCAGPSSPG